MKSFFGRLDALASSLNDQEKVDFLKEVKRYVQTGECLQYKNKMKYLKYWGMGSAEMAKALGVSDGTVRCAISRMSKELDVQFGQKFFDVVEKSFPDAVRVFEVVKKYRGVDSLFIPGFTQFLPEFGDGDYNATIDFKKCVKEREFLKKYTNKDIAAEVAELDEKKLCHLLSLMSNKKSRKGRFRLIDELLK